MVNGDVVKFKYPKVVADHYTYRGAVDNHNSMRHYGRTKYKIVLDSTWGTTCWTIQFFSFFIAYTEVNTYTDRMYLLNTYDIFMNFEKIG